MQSAAQASLLKCIGRRVRLLRTARGLTLRELAQEASLSPRFVSQLEAGQANIAVGRLDQVAGALAVGLTQLVAEEEAGPRARIEELLLGLSPEELERCQAALELTLGVERARAVALLGLRGAGKSTLGPQVGQALGLSFVELDDRVERAAGLSLTEVFSLHGEGYYRRLEQQCLAELLGEDQPVVVALSGGVVHNAEAFQLARRHTTTVWLKARPEDHMQRVLAQGDRRPMAESEDAMAELKNLLSTREPFYRQANLKVDTSREGKGTLKALLSKLASAGWTG